VPIISRADHLSGAHGRRARSVIVPPVSATAFPWLRSGVRRRVTATAQSERRAAMYRAELAERAALCARLGYSSKRTLARLKANAAWDFEVGSEHRPSGITDRDIGEIVKAAYARRAAR
jgi:hypothetical protein